MNVSRFLREVLYPLDALRRKREILLISLEGYQCFIEGIGLSQFPISFSRVKSLMPLDPFDLGLVIFLDVSCFNFSSYQKDPTLITSIFYGNKLTTFICIVVS